MSQGKMAQTRFRRLVGCTTIIAGLMQIGVVVTGVASARDPSAMMVDPAAITNIANGRLLGWSMALDMVGWYLLMVPLALFLHAWLRPKNPSLIDLATVCGLGFSLIGAIGAALMMVIAPFLVAEYAVASPARQETLDLLFRVMWGGVQTGLWLALETIPGGVWMLITGLLLLSERRALGILTAFLGVDALIGSTGAILGLAALIVAGSPWGFLFPIWSLWIGLVILRSPGLLEDHPRHLPVEVAAV